MADRPALAMYWASSCGGCEVSLLNVHEKVLDVAAHFDFMFCPCIMDTKRKDIEARADGSIALTLFNGAIRTDENEEMARLLRRKSRVLVAFGSCAQEGCIPAMADLHPRAGFLEAIYREGPTLDNPHGVLPSPTSDVPEGTLELPRFQDVVRTLAQVVDIDYSMPGCPPEPHRIGEVLDLLISGAPLPPRGSVIGAGVSNVCAECLRTRGEKKISRLYRTWEIVPDREGCLLDQGLLCMGPATRDGCGALCPQVNMPCIGCYGPPPGVRDQGARMVAALGSVLDIGETEGADEATLAGRIDALLDAIPDYSGVFYKFGFAASMMGKVGRLGR
jgi:F420-non-reducing hydrogenase small subunit